MISRQRNSWTELLHSWTVPPIRADRAFEEVVQAYSGQGRFYHTLDHVMDVLSTVQKLANRAKNLNAVKLAAWLHDVVYDTRASDNEERSAQYAERLCAELAIPEGPRVAALILKTKTHEAGDDDNAKVLLDADLAILGASEAVYADYAAKIRQEYAWVPEMQYPEGRRRVLETFSSRPRIYHYLVELEQSARRDMQAECARLAAASGAKL